MNIDLNSLSIVLNNYIDYNEPFCDENGNLIIKPPPRIEFIRIGDTLRIIEELQDKEAPRSRYIEHEIKNPTLLKIFRILLKIDYLKSMSIYEIKWMYLDLIACYEAGLSKFS